MVGVGLGGVTARHTCDGSQPHGWTGCYQASEVGQVDAGTSSRRLSAKATLPGASCVASHAVMPVSSLPAVLPDRLPDPHSCVAPTQGGLKPPAPLGSDR